MDELRSNSEIEEGNVDLCSLKDLLQALRRMKSAFVSLLVIVFPPLLSAFFPLFFCAKGGRSMRWEM